MVAGVVLDPFGVVDEGGGDDDDEEEDEEHEFVSARLESVDEDLQSGGVARQFEQPHDAVDAEELENVVLPLKAGKEEVQVEGQGGDDVDDVDQNPEESTSLARADQESNRQLEGEPGVA